MIIDARPLDLSACAIKQKIQHIHHIYQLSQKAKVVQQVLGNDVLVFSQNNLKQICLPHNDRLGGSHQHQRLGNQKGAH
ncbi:hypothetical protein FRX31_010341 [Thalictrum thalictroides]|uniref:Uncharacterized protein n=1 Tax=Thalictrum thalictroides TaxID=46969 RepID=A0A7J6WVF8_THATH|nr:hypothetical protein FRX31_010341 [Thalictrum thalictroides]